MPEIDSKTEGASDPLPRWVSSIAQASAMTGIPKAVLRKAKARGCPAFRHSRVDPAAAAEWVREHLQAPASVAPAPMPEPDAPAKRRTIQQEIEDLDVMLSSVDAYARSALAAGDVTTALQLLDQRKPLSDQRNNAMVQARRSGRTDDEVVPREEVERLAHAIARNAIVAVQRMAVEASEKLAGVETPAEMSRVLVGALCVSAYLRPFELALNLEAGHGLPSWVVEAFQRAAMEPIE